MKTQYLCIWKNGYHSAGLNEKYKKSDIKNIIFKLLFII